MLFDAWDKLIPTDYPERSFILDGIRYGFNIIDTCFHARSLNSVKCTNYKSTEIYQQEVEQQIQHELVNGNYIVCNSPPRIISALGAIPKGNGKIRLIHDASRPVGNCLNQFSDDNSCVYMDLRDACRLITQNCFLAKVDLKNAYRSVNIHPSNYVYTGLQWVFMGDTQPTFMYDAKLPFGAAKSPSIFQTLSRCVCHIMKTVYNATVIVYIDDFLVIEDSFDKCWHSYQTLIHVLRQLGFSISWSKCISPCQQLVFLGILIDTTVMTLSLPVEKMIEFSEMLSKFATRVRASKRQIESLIGKLNWACQVVQGGRTFLRRMLDVNNLLKHKNDKARLTNEFRQDLLWWISFMDTFNGTVSFLDRRPIKNIWTDACNSGGGGFYQGDYFYVNWNADLPQIRNEHINVKETIAIVLALERWASCLANKRVILYTDNIAARSYINKATTKNALLMNFLRGLFWTQAHYNFSVIVKHVKGCHNILADTISRIDRVDMFHKLYTLLPLESMGLVPFTFGELSKHMSLDFIHCRWGRAATNTNRDSSPSRDTWMGREHAQDIQLPTEVLPELL